jgi:hypothetical protein
MSEDPEKFGKEAGFWTGGRPGHRENGQSAGRPSGFPGKRGPKRAGVKTDLEFGTAGRGGVEDQLKK